MFTTSLFQGVVFLLVGVLIGSSLSVFWPGLTAQNSKTDSLVKSESSKLSSVPRRGGGMKFGPQIKKIHINVGPNVSPITPPDGDDTAVVAVEANLAIANHLREKFQKTLFPHRFFVVSCAVAGPPLSHLFQPFRFYNGNRGDSSSLAEALSKEWWATQMNVTSFYGPGPAGFDFVPVIPLQDLLDSIPTDLEIEFLKTDTQGFDLSVLKSASREAIRRIARIQSETYSATNERYAAVNNRLIEDWIPFMTEMGFELTNPVKKGKLGRLEYDAVWVRID